jgi:hypothetical protein
MEAAAGADAVDGVADAVKEVQKDNRRTELKEQKMRRKMDRKPALRAKSVRPVRTGRVKTVAGVIAVGEIAVKVAAIVGVVRVGARSVLGMRACASVLRRARHATERRRRSM